MARKKRSSFATVFDPFIEQTQQEFAYLVNDFGFEHHDTSIVSYECSLGFRKQGVVAITAFYEAGSVPWLMLIGRRQVGRRARTVEAALDFVIERRCPEQRVPLPDVPFPRPYGAVSSVLREYAVALRECASDFLAGDPTVVFEVQPAVSAAHRKALARDWREERRALAAYRKKTAQAGKGRPRRPSNRRS